MGLLFLPIEKLPPWLLGPLLLGIGVASLVHDHHDADAWMFFGTFGGGGLAISAYALAEFRRRATWRRIVGLLREHDPLLQWSTERQERCVGWLGSPAFVAQGARGPFSLGNVGDVLVFADCRYEGRDYRCDLPSLAAALAALRCVDARPATLADRLPGLPAADALALRVGSWPRLRARLALTDDELDAIQRRRHP